MRIRNKITGQIHEVIAGTLYAENIFEEVTDEEIKVGEPTVEIEIKESTEELDVKRNGQKVDIASEDDNEKAPSKKVARKAKKGAKKNEPSRK